MGPVKWYEYFDYDEVSEAQNFNKPDKISFHYYFDVHLIIKKCDAQ